jgi:Fe-S cluster assembly protein SufD
MSASVRSVASAAQPPALRSFEAQWRQRLPDALAPLREQAMQRFLRLGLPTTRDETWRYTNLRGLAAQSFVAGPANALAASQPAAASWLTDGGRIPSILLVNGYPALKNDVAAAIGGIEIRSLRDLAQQDPSLLSRHLAHTSDADQQRWELLNTALFGDGLFINIDKAVATPLLLVHLASGSGAGNASYPRLIVTASPGSSATIIEHHVAGNDQPSFCNSVTQIELGAGARIEHYRVFASHAQATAIDTLDIQQGKDSVCRQFTIALGGDLVRTNLQARLQEPGALLESHSLLVGQGSRHIDCVAVATHAAPDTRSRQTARSIASGTSRAIFNSKVIVEAGATRADSQQSCRGLLLSPTAEIDTRPQLEIHTDEVKCAHGATTGRLDPDMFFYLLSRGLDRATAQSLLVFAFLDDVLTGMSLPAARVAIEGALIAQLPNAQILRAFR